MQSESINELVTALAVVQGKMKSAAKDAVNPHFKSKYADLVSVWDSCRALLSENGLVVIQGNKVDTTGVIVTTTLAHKSGQWVTSEIYMMPKDFGPQAVGSCITYGRRYGLAAMVGIVADEDDDGNAGEKKGKEPPKEKEPLDISAALAKFTAAKSREDLKTAWGTLSPAEKMDKGVRDAYGLRGKELPDA